MIPHHEATLVGEERFDHNLTHCDNTLEGLQSSCDLHDEIDSENHENCPLHFHQCTFQEFDVNRSSTQRESNPKSRDLTVALLSIDLHTQARLTKDGVQNEYFVLDSYKNQIAGTISLRAPPVLS
jgi:hypothetical protein